MPYGLWELFVNFSDRSTGDERQYGLVALFRIVINRYFNSVLLFKAINFVANFIAPIDRPQAINARIARSVGPHIRTVFIGLSRFYHLNVAGDYPTLTNGQV